jgi:hypothetical protein
VSIADGTSVIPPGWYPDPADSARLRRWDGQQWTQEVILAPEQEPVSSVAEPTAAPEHPAAPSSPSMASQPPPDQPVPASPAPTSPPPGEPTQPAPPPAPAPPLEPAPPTVPAPPAAPSPPPAAPAVPDAPIQPTIPRPSPPVNQNPNPPSGPVSLPEWANLPGLTLPPDLSSILGTGNESILHRPTFEETEERALPTLPVFEPPFIPQRPDVQDVGREASPAPAPQRVAQDAPPAATQPPAQPATPYAPPPVGAKYDVPPPPGMAHLPTAGPVLPPSAFVAAQVTNTAPPQLPPVGAAPQTAPAVTPPILEQAPSRQVVADIPPSANLLTISSLLIGALPLLQFAVIYVIFGLLAVILAPGMQWGILAAPAAFSLLFANADRKKLTILGVDSPSIVFAFIPPLYLIVRLVTTGRSSLIPLIAWVILQAGAVAGIYYLLPTVLSAGMRAMGIK